jgi:hypothetical protein
MQDELGVGGGGGRLRDVSGANCAEQAKASAKETRQKAEAEAAKADDRIAPSAMPTLTEGMAWLYRRECLNSIGALEKGSLSLLWGRGASSHGLSRGHPAKCKTGCNLPSSTAAARN